MERVRMTEKGVRDGVSWRCVAVFDCMLNGFI